MKDIRKIILRNMVPIENKTDIRFAGLLALTFNIQENSEETKTFCVTKTDIFYNKEFVSNLTDKIISMIIFHEVMHVLNFHVIRSVDKNPDIWNIACDYVANNLTSKYYSKELENFSRIHLNGEEILNKIKDDTFLIYYDPTLTENFIRNNSTEDIYNILLKSNMKNDRGNKFDLGEHSEEGKIRNGDFEDLIRDKIIKVKKTLADSQDKGINSILLNRLINKIEQKDCVFIDELINELITLSGDEISYWGKPTILDNLVGGKLPRYKNYKNNNAIFVVDTSGSMTDIMVREPLQQIMDLVNNYDLDKIAIVYWDTKCKNIEIFEDEELEFNPKGGGGTSFIKLFKWFEQEGFELCEMEDDEKIFIWTDGEAYFPKEKCIDNEVVWIINNSIKKINPSLGRTINIR